MYGFLLPMLLLRMGHSLFQIGAARLELGPACPSGSGGSPPGAWAARGAGAGIGRHQPLTSSEPLAKPTILMTTGVIAGSKYTVIVCSYTSTYRSPRKYFRPPTSKNKLPHPIQE